VIQQIDDIRGQDVDLIVILFGLPADKGKRNGVSVHLAPNPVAPGSGEQEVNRQAFSRKLTANFQ